MVLQMIGSIDAHLGADRRTAQITADPVIEARMREQCPMRGIVHQDGQTELAAADDHDG